MGIKGLLPLLSDVIESCSLEELARQSISCVGIDGFSWLHKAAYTCSAELCRNEKTTKWMDWFMHRIGLFLHHKIQPFIVFDGARYSLKNGTEVERRQSRERSMAAAVQLCEQQKYADATKFFQKAVDITNEMVHQLVVHLKSKQISYIVAPYEADAQLAYLSKQGIVGAVVSEDSDLLTFGCTRVLFKMDQFGHAQMIQLKNVYNSQFFSPLTKCLRAAHTAPIPGLAPPQSHHSSKRRSPRRQQAVAKGIQRTNPTPDIISASGDKVPTSRSCDSLKHEEDMECIDLEGEFHGDEEDEIDDSSSDDEATGARSMEASCLPDIDVHLLHAFQCVCVLSGCDYVDSLDGMGLKTARDVVLRALATVKNSSSFLFPYASSNLEKILGKHYVPSSLPCFQPALVPTSLMLTAQLSRQGYSFTLSSDPDARTDAALTYTDRVDRALLGFKHQKVFEPSTNHITFLTPIWNERTYINTELLGRVRGHDNDCDDNKDDKTDLLAIVCARELDRDVAPRYPLPVCTVGLFGGNSLVRKNSAGAGDAGVNLEEQEVEGATDALSFLGAFISPNTSIRVARGEVHPETLVPFADDVTGTDTTAAASFGTPFAGQLLRAASAPLSPYVADRPPSSSSISTSSASSPWAACDMLPTTSPWLPRIYKRLSSNAFKSSSPVRSASASVPSSQSSASSSTISSSVSFPYPSPSSATLLSPASSSASASLSSSSSLSSLSSLSSSASSSLSASTTSSFGSAASPLNDSLDLSIESAFSPFATPATFANFLPQRRVTLKRKSTSMKAGATPTVVVVGGENEAPVQPGQQGEDAPSSQPLLQSSQRMSLSFPFSLPRRVGLSKNYKASSSKKVADR